MCICLITIIVVILILLILHYNNDNDNNTSRGFRLSPRLSGEICKDRSLLPWIYIYRVLVTLDKLPQSPWQQHICFVVSETSKNNKNDKEKGGSHFHFVKGTGSRLTKIPGGWPSVFAPTSESWQVSQSFPLNEAP